MPLPIAPTGSSQPSYVSGLTVSSVRVENPLLKNKLSVFWEPGSNYPLGFNVYRALSPNSEHATKLNTDPITIPQYLDETVEDDKKAFYYYWVTAIFASDEEVVGGPVTLQGDLRKAKTFTTLSPRKFYMESIRRKHIILNRTAQPVHIMVQKVAGTRCTCFDDEMTQSEYGCSLCYGVGWTGGYELLRDIPLRIQSFEQRVEATTLGLVFKDLQPAWLANWPLIRNDDVIVTDENFRYRAQDVSWIDHQGVLTEQTLNLEFIDSCDVLYEFVVA